MHRYRWLIAGICLLLIVASVVGMRQWRRYRADRRAEEALAALEQHGVLPTDPELLLELGGDSRYDRELTLLNGVFQLREGETDQALRTLGRLRPQGRIRLPLFLAVGEAHYKAGRLAEAEGIFRLVASENPDLAIAHRWLATVNHEIGAMYASLRHLQKVTELEPGNFFAWFMMGRIYLKDFGDQKSAAESYRMALARNPPEKHVQAIRMELAEALIDLVDFTGALEVLNAAEEDAAVLGLKAHCRWTLGKTEEAEQLFERAKALNPGASAVLLFSARLALERKQPQAAVEPLKTLTAHDPLNDTAHYLLSQAYQQLGDKGAAAAEVASMNEAKALRKKLAETYEQAMQRTNDPEIRDELADLCEQLGKPDLARIWRRAAEELRRSAGAVDSGT